MQSERSRKTGVARRRKIALACEPCRERKSRCDGHKPTCASCVRRALPLTRCVYKAENSRSAFSDEYVHALQQRILELEGGTSAATTSSPVQASHGAVPIPLSEGSGTGRSGRPAVVSGAEIPGRSETRGVAEQRPRPPQPVMEALGNTETRSFNTRIYDRRTSIDSPSHVTGMGAMTTAQDNERFSSHNAQYFGSSSTASLMSLLAHPEQQGSRGITSQSNPSHNTIGESQVWSQGTSLLATSDAFILPPRDFADHLLGCFWDRVYCIYPFFDRRSFQEAYENLWMPTRRAIHQVTQLNVGLGDRTNSGPASIVLNCALNTMFALGCLLTDISIQDRETMVDQFFDRAKHHIGLDMINIQSIGVVQTLLIVALFLQSTPYPHRCWNSIGTACRLALGLGLHDAQLEKSKTPLEREIHRRTWHGCVMLDMTVSMTYGRPSMTAHLKSVPLPGNFDLETRQETEESSLAPFYVSTIKLYSILDNILSDVYKAWRGRLKEYTPETKQPELDLIIQLEDQLLQYQSSVPSHLSWINPSTLASEASDHLIIRRQRNVLHLRYLYLQLLLYRPTFTQLCLVEKLDEPRYGSSNSLYSFMLGKCAAGCIQAAVDLITLVHETYKTSTADTWWYNGFYTSTAAMILIMSYKCRSVKDFENSKIDFTWQKAEEILQHMASFSTSSRNTLGFLRSIWAQVLPSSDVTRHASLDDLASQEACFGHEQAGIQPSFNAGQPFNSDGGVPPDELGFLGPCEFNDFQDWFLQVGV